jgi:hypothetical protein
VDSTAKKTEAAKVNAAESLPAAEAKADTLTKK